MERGFNEPYHWAINERMKSNCIVFLNDYCDSNIGLFSITLHLVIALPIFQKFGISYCFSNFGIAITSKKECKQLCNSNNFSFEKLLIFNPIDTVYVVRLKLSYAVLIYISMNLIAPKLFCIYGAFLITKIWNNYGFIQSFIFQYCNSNWW